MKSYQQIKEQITATENEIEKFRGYTKFLVNVLCTILIFEILLDIIQFFVFGHVIKTNKTFFVDTYRFVYFSIFFCCIILWIVLMILKYYFLKKHVMELNTWNHQHTTKAEDYKTDVWIAEDSENTTKSENTTTHKVRTDEI